jgi:putative hydrolase of HD superfamily
MEKLDKFMDFVLNLKKTVRTGWVHHNIKNPESVADHSYSTALLCMMLCPKELNKERVIKMALLHDLAESITGDIITVINSEMDIEKKREKDEKEAKAIEKISSFLEEESKKEFLDIINEYKDRKTPESKFVKNMDDLEMIFQARNYEKSQGKDLSDFYETIEKKNISKESRKIFEYLKNSRN